MTPLLQFQGVAKRYGAVRALDGVDLRVETGSIVALLGPNGAGKSTLFGCLLGLTRPTAGELLLHGRPVGDEDRLRFGYVAERIALYSQRTVWDNALFFARLKGQPSAEVERQLARVGLLDVRTRKARELSKGMLQRLGLAIALCGRPELLVLDEPFNGLDPAHLDELQETLFDEHKRGATLLIATHTMSAIEPLATHVAILLDGTVATSGTLDELQARYHDEPSLEAIYHRIARERRIAEPGKVLA